MCYWKFHKETQKKVYIMYHISDNFITHPADIVASIISPFMLWTFQPLHFPWPHPHSCVLYYLIFNFFLFLLYSNPALLQPLHSCVSIIYHLLRKRSSMTQVTLLERQLGMINYTFAWVFLFLYCVGSVWGTVTPTMTKNQIMSGNCSPSAELCR